MVEYTDPVKTNINLETKFHADLLCVISEMLL